MLKPYRMMLVILAVGALPSALAATAEAWKVYTNHTFNVSLKYPSEWRKIPRYDYRYGGRTGFFQVSAVSGESVKIDQVAENEANRAFHPYGTKPRITAVKVAGRDARLIMPVDDQPKSLQWQAALIVRMPEPTCLGSQRYTYLIISSDRAHIREIGDTVKFIKPERHC